ncbi:TetR/AcrR family transcriptional regulator [Mycobacterium camsae]|uniref:TetR/AcrR family transcriptional regulator n=1 Tax=Mycobacterium gordonae TaxID=1778 RepID=UPI00197E51BA|nr:TetR/AcrR family transcriptional regulator [Mycobacterium gordonae]
MTEPVGRSARKRLTILSAGRELFLGNGYQGTSVDAIAASAAVSKQTVYKHFGDKHQLLMAIVTDALDTTVSAFVERASTLAETTDLERDLTAFAADYLRAVLQEHVVQLRRLVVGEANRLPDLAALYYERAPGRMFSALADCFSRLDQRGLLEVPEPATAAEHFAFLVVGRCIDRALFSGGPQVESDIDVDHRARSGVRVFLAGYRPGGRP